MAQAFLELLAARRVVGAVLVLASFALFTDDTPDLNELYEKAARAQLKADIQAKIGAIAFEQAVTTAIKNAKPNPNHKGGVSYSTPLTSPPVLTYRGTQAQLKGAREENEKRLKELAKEKSALEKLTAVTPRLEAHVLKAGTIGVPYWRNAPISVKVVDVVDADHVRVEWLKTTYLVKTPAGDLKKGDPLAVDFVVYVTNGDGGLVFERFTPKDTSK